MCVSILRCLRLHCSSAAAPVFKLLLKSSKKAAMEIQHSKKKESPRGLLPSQQLVHILNSVLVDTLVLGALHPYAACCRKCPCRDVLYIFDAPFRQLFIGSRQVHQHSWFWKVHHSLWFYTAAGHDLISAAITLASPTRCLFSSIVPETLWCYRARWCLHQLIHSVD